MNIKGLIENMKLIQCALLKFVEDEANTEENYDNFLKIIADQKIIEDRYKLKSLLQLINSIGNNHQRVYNFIDKIEQILIHIKKSIISFFTNSEIFKLFEENKRILLSLIQEKIIIIDEYIVSEITKNYNFKKKYPEYFAPEIRPFLTDEFINKYKNQNMNLKNIKIIHELKKEVSKEFYEKRKKGENDNYLCELIRLNDAKKFSIYVIKNYISLQSDIKESIFETNSIFLDIIN